jgi:dTDP-4-dehydrorhamnose reductase
MRFLITGAKGQLAGEFLRILQNHSLLPIASRLSPEITALDKRGLDISDLNTVLEAVSYYKPDVVINCAAFNFVDKAEDNFDTAFKVNALGTKNLAHACKKHDALLIHYSSDYVFDGTKDDFYTEQDEPNPINNYGKSKLEGEKFLLGETDKFLLFRVSWVFGEGKQNFLYKLKEWTEKQNIVKVVCDQISVPTYTEDIVRVTIHSIDAGLTGVFHLTNSGYASRYEVARYFIERLGHNSVVLPVCSDYFSTQAKRPYFSAMSNANISKILSLHVPDWKDGIDRFMKRVIKG